jgi:hypothetical protein
MAWHPESVVDDFRIVARLAGVELPGNAISIENLPAPHVSPTRLPVGKMAVYVFSNGSDVLKVGKVDTNSQAPKTSRDAEKDCGEPGCPNDHRSQGFRPWRRGDRAER